MAVDAIFTVNGSVAAKLAGAALALEPEVDALLDVTSATLLTTIKRNASGRPGPNAPTGDYRRSWTRRKVKDGYNVGTNRPQARRLERGFYGTDSLGRVYNQPPFPHLGPAIDAVTPGFEQAMGVLASSVAGLTFGSWKR